MARRRRRERIVGGLLAVLGLAVLAVAVVALRHPGNRVANAGVITRTLSPTTTATSPTTSATTSATTATSATASSSTGAPAKLPLIVLNNTSIHGLAQSAQTAFDAGGWTVTRTGNLQNDIVSTCAYYDPDVAGAQVAATALRAQFPAIKRVEPKFAELPAGPIVVVLTSDYSSG